MDQRGVILIVDGDPAGRKSLASLLFPSEYRLVFAASGHDAIRKAVGSEPLLILLNPSIPAPDGFDLCRMIRGNAVLGEIPILLVTAVDDDHARRRGLEAGADGFIHWPYDRSETRSRIRTIIRLNRFRKSQDDVDLLHRAEEEVSRHRQQLETLSRRLLQAQEEERRAIARELHDEVGQILTVLKINLVLTQREVRDQVGPRLLAESVDLVDRLIGQVRDLWRNLRPSLLDELGLPSALQALVDSAAKRAGLDVEFQTDPRIERLAPDWEITCYRVVQESLTNVIRHSRARCVRVELAQSEAYFQISVSDDGIGFDVEEVLSGTSAGAHMGVLGMRERLSLVGGTLSIESRPGHGTQVRVSLPLRGSIESSKARRPRDFSRTRPRQCKSE
jgi:signal transduction histidine kinase